jgi:hypothetical protein
MPRLRGMEAGSGKAEIFAPSVLQVRWRLGDGSVLRLTANFANEEARLPESKEIPGEILFETMPENSAPCHLSPWEVRWTLQPPDAWNHGQGIPQESRFQGSA